MEADETWLDNAGVSPNIAKRITGHSRERTLRKHYHRSTVEQALCAVEALPEVPLLATGTDNARSNPQQYTQQ